ncbi:MAG: hypothetical protein GC202_14170 [Alphaproteobacteria bacterium]|nr:hypothetical protein [Alphaproteobacteria bacterium]
MGLLDWLNPLKPLTDAALAAERTWLNSKNDADRIKLEENVAFWQAQVESQQIGSREPPWSARNLMSYSVASFVVKIVVWDTVLQGWTHASTDNPGQLVTWVVVTVIGAHFLSRSGETIAGAIARTIVSGRGRSK